MRAFAILLAVTIGGCSSVRVVQRDGCWVRRTTGSFGQVREEVGPCARPAPLWATDRVTRLVQECVVRADYQWHTRALAAWNRGESLPEQEPEEKVLRACMGESSRVMAEENATLKSRLAETASERDALRASSEQERAHLRTTLDRVAEQLGEAAKKPLPPAVATATASSEGRTESSAPTAPAAPITFVAPPAPAATPAAATAAAPRAPACTPDGKASRQARSAKKGEVRAPACPPAALDVRPATTGTPRAPEPGAAASR